MTTDDTVTAKGAGRSIPDLLASAVPGVLQERVRDAALAVLSDPEVLDGIAGVLREHSESKGDASFLPSCRCGWVGSSRMAWVADLARHQTAALADWLRGGDESSM